MPTPFESALLNLKLYDLRQEELLREASDWFFNDFKPDTFNDLAIQIHGERNASFRMVIGYWEMAASLVTTGAIDGSAFRAAHGEVFATFAKIQPFLAELRRATGEVDFCRHLEQVVLADPDAAAILKRRREADRATPRRPPQR